MRSRTLEAKDMPRRENSRSEASKITTYFESLHRAFAGHGDDCLFLPSLLTMSKQLNCSPLEIHEALRKLVVRGYQFITLGGMDTPVTLWYPRNRKAS